MANWPGCALFAMRGASILTRKMVFDVLSGYFSAILNILSDSAFQCTNYPSKGIEIIYYYITFSC